MPVISTNTAANASVTSLARTSRNQDKSIARLSSGSRIGSASDDAAGLAVGMRLKSDIAVLKQGVMNAQQGQAMLKVADGALSRVGDILQRMKGLAAQSLSGSVDNTARGFINTEYQQLMTEIENTADQTEFNNANLIDGSFNQNFFVGFDATDTIVTNLTTVDSQTAGATALNISGGAVDTQVNATTAFNALDTAINTNLTDRATVGALMSRFEFRTDMLNSSIESLDAARSAILDVDIASEQTNLINQEVLMESGIAALAQANRMKKALLGLVRQ